jgi:hypothetical protein
MVAEKSFIKDQKSIKIELPCDTRSLARMGSMAYVTLDRRSWAKYEGLSGVSYSLGLRV